MSINKIIEDIKATASQQRLMLFIAVDFTNLSTPEEASLEIESVLCAGSYETSTLDQIKYLEALSKILGSEQFSEFSSAHSYLGAILDKSHANEKSRPYTGLCTYYGAMDGRTIFKLDGDSHIAWNDVFMSLSKKVENGEMPSPELLHALGLA